MRRELPTYAILALLVGGLAGAAWLTRHPDHPWVARAARWPVVGPAAARFREVYLPPTPGPARAASEGGREIVWIPADPDAVGALPFVVVPEGAAVRAAPEAAGASLALLEATVNLPYLERRGEWFRVRWGRGQGWVRVENAGSRPAPLGDAAAPPGPLPGRPPDPAVLAAARSLLAEGTERRSPPLPARLGPYPLWTDVTDAGLLALLDRVAAGSEGAYRARYGLEPVGWAAEAVVLFRDDERYAALVTGDDVLAGLPATGHVGAGVVVMPTAGRPQEVAGTLVHELAHLLNRRAIGPALPPWLDEGIADDLAASLLPGQLDAAVRDDGVLELRGAAASLLIVQSAIASGQAVPLHELLAMDWEAFVRSDRRELHYAQAGLFVRCLLAGGDPALARGFRDFLKQVAAGGPVGGEALRESLGVPWPELEERCRAWTLAISADRPG